MPGFTQIPNDEVFDDPLWTSEKFTKGQAYCDLYRLAQFQPGKVQKRGIIIELEPGQIGWSQAELSKRWKRSLGWVRRLLRYLEKAGHIVLQKTNVSTTITLLHWVPDSTADGTAEGSQMVQQKDSRRYTNNIVNTENTVNTGNTHKGGDVFDDLSIGKLWQGWIEDPKSLPTEREKAILIKALEYNSDADGFWLPFLDSRREINASGGFVSTSMKYWFDCGFREMKESPKKWIDQFKRAKKGECFRVFCTKCGTMKLPNNEFQLQAGSSCCGAEYSPVPIQSNNSGY